MVSMGTQGKILRDRSKNKNFAIKNPLHNKPSQRSYQWGYTGEILKCKTQNYENIFSLKIQYQKKYLKGRINDRTKERY